MSINLAALQAAARANYSNFEFDAGGSEPLRFRPILRCDRPTRQAYADAMNIEKQVRDVISQALEAGALADDEDDVDIVSIMINCMRAGMRVVAATPADFEALDALLKLPNDDGDLVDDLALWEEVTREYKKATEAGEA